MNIDREVVIDLLPLYLSGEASLATRKLVEECAQEDVEIAALLKNPILASPVLHEELAPPKELEMKSLERTKSLLKLRGIVLGIAIFLSLLPFSVRGGREGVRWLWSGAEPYAITVVGLAALAWGSYAVLQRRLRVSGL